MVNNTWPPRVNITSLSHAGYHAPSKKRACLILAKNTSPSPDLQGCLDNPKRSDISRTHQAALIESINIEGDKGGELWMEEAKEIGHMSAKWDPDKI